MVFSNKLVIITGPKESGKTQKLYKYLEKIGDKTVIIYGCGKSKIAKFIKEFNTQILNRSLKYDVICIDDAHTFIDMEVINFVKCVLRDKKMVMVSGLMINKHKKLYNYLIHLNPLAEDIVITKKICFICKKKTHIEVKEKIESEDINVPYCWEHYPDKFIDKYSKKKKKFIDPSQTDALKELLKIINRNK